MGSGLKKKWEKIKITSIPWNNEPAPFGFLSAIFLGKIFFEWEKIVFLKKKMKKKFWKKFGKKIFFSIFSIL